MTSSGFTTDPSTWPEPPVILITGGNGGVGFGIAQRMLEQLSYPQPPDTACVDNAKALSPFCTPHGCKIVIASRNEAKGRNALGDLLYATRMACRGRMKGKGSLDSQEKTLKQPHRQLECAEYVAHWFSNLKLDFVKLDLSSVDKTLEAADLVRKKFGYLTHLILNAAAAPILSVNMLGVFMGLVTNPVYTLTTSANNVEERGRMTDDGLGWTWQCNVFGHYILARQLLPMLYASKHRETRIIWTSSLEASAHYFDPKDPMALSTKDSYASTKYQALLLSLDFNRYIRQYERKSKAQNQVVSFSVEPGIVASDMVADILGPLLYHLQRVVFFMARLMGLTKMTLTSYTAGMAFVFIALTPLSAISRIMYKTRKESHKGQDSVSDMENVRFGARVSRWGSAYCEPHLIGDPLDEGAAATDERNAKELAERCDSLYQGFLAVRGGDQPKS